MNNLLLQVQIFLRARYPILYLISHEEDRVVRAMKKVAATEKMELVVWNSTYGSDGIEDSTNPFKLFQYIDQCTDPCLFVLLDFHHFIEEKSYARWLRDLTKKMVIRKQAIIILAPRMVIPEELEKLITTFNVPLPDAHEGERILRILCKNQNLTIDPEVFQRFVQGALGLTELEIKRMYSRIMLVGSNFDPADLSMQIEEKRRAIRKSRFLEFWDISQLTLEVGGLDNLKRWLRERQLAFLPEAKEYGLPEPKGLFLLGVQGCGKSLMAKAVAKMWQLPLLRLDVASVLQAGAEEGLRETIRISESLAPAILWIDELEKGFAQTNEKSVQGLGTLLTWMQEKEKPIFVVATANEVRSLPPELLRKGRFDEIFFVDLPDPHERLEVLDIHLRKRNRLPENFDLTVVVEESERYSGAELEQVVVSAMFRAFSEDREVDTEDLIEATREIVPLAVTMDDRIKNLRDWARSRTRPATADRRRVDFFAEWEKE
jgi:AAA+ superfamily predicted ATPase